MARYHDGWCTVLGKRVRTVSLLVHPVLAEGMRYARKQAPGVAIFSGSRKRRPVTPQTIWNWTHQVADAVGIERITTHQLRHPAITEVNDRTGDLQVAQESRPAFEPEDGQDLHAGDRPAADPGGPIDLLLVPDGRPPLGVVPSQSSAARSCDIIQSDAPLPLHLPTLLDPPDRRVGGSHRGPRVGRRLGHTR